MAACGWLASYWLTALAGYLDGWLLLLWLTVALAVWSGLAGWLAGCGWLTVTSSLLAGWLAGFFSWLAGYLNAG